MLSYQSNVVQAMQQSTAQQQQNQQQPQHDSNIQNNIHQLQQQQTMRLRDDPPAITPPARSSKKRKSPASNIPEPAQPLSQPQPPTQQPMQHVLPPPHALMHPHSIPSQLPPGFAYAPVDYTPGGIPPNAGHPPQQQPRNESPPTGSGRALSSSKRAEQNRKAQRAFRERRDQHVKALESRSQLLDAALASADEANRRWEECRALVDQLRVENAALRAALSQAQLLPPNTGNSNAPVSNQEDGNSSNELKNDSMVTSVAEQNSD